MPQKRNRKRPGRHTVHTRDPRYNLSEYGRGEGDLAQGTSSHYEVKDPAEVIADQIRAFEPLWQPRYSVKTLVKVDENTLRICSKPRGRNQVNMDIKYNSGTDAYDITAYEIARDMSVYEVYSVDYIMADNLTDVMDRVLLKRDFKRKRLVQKGIG